MSMSNNWLAAGVAATMVLMQTSMGFAQTVAGAAGDTHAGTSGGTGLGTNAGTSGGTGSGTSGGTSGGASATGGTPAGGATDNSGSTGGLSPGGAAGAQAAGLGTGTVLLGIGAAVVVGTIIAVSEGGGHSGTPTTTGTH
jgi:hypothetical protein